MTTSTFKRQTSRNVGTTLAPVGGYVVGGGVTAIVTGLSLGNSLTTKAILVDVTVNDGVNNYYLRKSFPLAAGESADIMAGVRHVLQAGDSVEVRSSDPTSLDVIMSILERS